MKNLKTFEEFKIPKWLASLNKVTAKCDNCEYKEAIDLNNLTEADVDRMEGKKCPKCQTVMINNNDVKMFKKALKLLHVDDRDFKYGRIRYQTKKNINNMKNLKTYEAFDAENYEKRKIVNKRLLELKTKNEIEQEIEFLKNLLKKIIEDYNGNDNRSFYYSSHQNWYRNNIKNRIEKLQNILE
jgi:hypothetical protein